MNSRLFFLIVIFSSIFFSCSNSEDKLTNIIGSWKLTDVKVNNKTQNNSLITAHFLNFPNEKDYKRTYVTGTWKLNNNIIELDAVSDSYDWNLEIIEITSKILKVKMRLTEIEYGWDFNEFSKNEVLSITETYEKVKL